MSDKKNDQKKEFIESKKDCAGFLEKQIREEADFDLFMNFMTLSMDEEILFSD